jgi:large subunit ribosomal protein L15
MFELHTLTRLVKPRKRVGRGGSRGGQSGRGGKGQTARSGGSIRPGFEGGQMPLHRRLPKRGFTNRPFQDEIKVVNLADLERAFDANSEINPEKLNEKGLVKLHKGIQTRIKVLGDGVLTKKFTVMADFFSATAKQAIEKVGGTVVYKTKGE